MQSLICGALNLNKLDRKEAAKVKQIERREIEEKVDVELEDERKVKKRKKRERKRKAEEEARRADKRRNDGPWGSERYKPCKH